MSRWAFFNLNRIILSFQHLNLIEPLLKALNDEGYTVPTPIQEQAIPIILDRKDLLGCAQTGTGKTAAFALPMLQLLCEDAAKPADDGHRGGPRPVRALILTPTRELAIQIDESFANYGRYTGLRHLVIFGGVPQQAQVQALQRGTDILVATPGRLLDLCDQKLLDLRNIRYFVLDEADRMLDMGFINDVRKILTKLPQKKHSLFFSATMPGEIQKLANSILVNPSKVEVTPESTTAETIEQSIYFVDKKDKRSLLLHVLKGDTIPTALVFTRTKHGADKVAQGLTRAGIRAEAIHGNKSQNARQRALENFKKRQTRILVATDIAARGIDIDDLTHVINFELPNVAETYVHRIGRTGRAGASGTALSFCDLEEKEFLRDIQKLIARKIPVVEDHPHVLYGGISMETASTTSATSNQSGRNNAGTGNRNDGGQRRNNPGNGNRNGQQQGGQRRNNPGGGIQRNSNNGRPPGRDQRPVRPAQPLSEQERLNPELQHLPEQRIEKAVDQHLDGQHIPEKASAPERRRPEQQRSRPPQATGGGAPEQKRNGSLPGGNAPGTDRPRKIRPAHELKSPEAGKEYKDPLENIDLKINRIEGDEKW
jgi:ATP-dependent RNA helicase RhlE